jgi:RNA polymerase sigma factor (sigma-70 family)
MLSDTKLWDDFREDKKYALSHIYYHHVEPLYQYGKKFTKDENLVKDTIQELFMDMIRTREKLGPTDNIRYYLMTAFKHRIIRSLNGNKRFIDSEFTEQNYELTISYSYEEEIINTDGLTKQEELIRKALAEISPKQREILFYRYTCDFDYEMICDIMSIKYDSARKLVFRALKSVREQLKTSDILVLFFLRYPPSNFLKK